MNKTITAMTLLLWSGWLLAHNFVTDNSGWCPLNTNFSGFVTLTAEELNDHVHNRIACEVPLVPDGSFEAGSENQSIIDYIQPAFNGSHFHGDIDDPDFWEDDARVSVAYAMCACASRNGKEYMDPSVIRPIISTLTATSSNHHDDYSLEDGLEFSCQVCPRLQSTGNGNVR